MARSITLGKVLLALAIFFAGLLLARWGYSLTARFSPRWLRNEKEWANVPAKVSQLIAQAAVEHPHVMKKPAPDVLFDNFGGSSLVFTLKFWTRLCPTIDGGKVRSDLRHRINTLFEQEGIVFAFPKGEVHLDTTRPLEVNLTSFTDVALYKRCGSRPLISCRGDSAGAIVASVAKERYESDRT